MCEVKRIYFVAQSKGFDYEFVYLWLTNTVYDNTISLTEVTVLELDLIIVIG